MGPVLFDLCIECIGFYRKSVCCFGRHTLLKNDQIFLQ